MIRQFKNIIRAVPKPYRKLLIIFIVSIFAINGISWMARAIAYDVLNGGHDHPKHEHSHELIKDFGTVVNIGDLKCGYLQEKARQGNTIERVGEYIDNRNIPYTMWYFAEDGIPTTIVTFDYYGACGLAYSPDLNEYITEAVPLEVARQLMLQFYQAIAAEQGGIESYRESVAEAFTTPRVAEGYVPGDEPIDPVAPTVITSIDEWVFKQLEIDLPEDSYTVIDIDNEWVYEDYDPTNPPELPEGWEE